MTKPTSLMALALLLATGCVARDAGYSQVRSVVADRTGHDVRWHRQEGEQKAGQTRDLLAKPLTADSAARLALLNHPDLQAAFERVALARAALVAGRAPPNPHLEAELGFHEGHDRPDVEIGLTEDIIGLALIPARNAAGRAGLDAASYDVAGRALDVIYSAQVAYYDFVAAEQMLELRQTVAAATRAGLEAATRIRQAGNSTELALANEQSLYEESRLSLEKAEIDRSEAWQRLNAALGLWGPWVKWTATPRLSDPRSETLDLGAVEQKAVERSLDLAAIRQNHIAEAMRADIASVRGWLPGLRVGVRAAREEDFKIGPTVELELPLFDQGQGAVALAEAGMELQARLADSVALRLRTTVRTVSARLVAAQQRIVHYRTVLMPLRQRVVDETQLAYNGMLVGVFQLLQARRDQIEAGRGYIEALHTYWVSRTALDQLVAGRLIGGVLDPGMGPSSGDSGSSEPNSEH